MKFTHRRKFTTETERKFTVTVNRQPMRFFCSTCDGEVEMLSINEAAVQRQTGWRKIVFSIAAGELHSAETEQGEIYVCAASLTENRKIH